MWLYIFYVVPFNFFYFYNIFGEWLYWKRSLSCHIICIDSANGWLRFMAAAIIGSQLKEKCHRLLQSAESDGEQPLPR